jgi:hypothetical protein
MAIADLIYEQSKKLPAREVPDFIGDGRSASATAT